MKPRHPATVYRGIRHVGPAGEVLGCEVRVGDRELPLGPSLRLWAHSPTGFEWGYAGSGPSQLALALMLDATADPDLALRCYQWVKWYTVVNFGESWQITAGALFDLVENWRRRTEQADAEPIAAFVPEGGVA